MLAPFAGTLRPEQAPAVDAALAQVRSLGGALLQASTGMGKTSMALWIATQLQVKTVVLVHKSFLMDQWRERCAQFVPGARVTTVQGAAADVSGDIVIVMIQSLLTGRHAQDLFERAGLLIVDESHRIGAPAFSQVMFGLTCRYVLGLTATPCRRDGLERVMHDFLGPTAYVLQRQTGAGVRVITVPYSTPRYRTQPLPTNRRGDLDYTGLMTRLVEDEERTTVIVRVITDLAKQGRQLLVLSHRRAHCTSMVAALQRVGVQCAAYLGSSSTKASSKGPPDTQVIVATYSLASEGLDVPRLDALVLATPASDVVQACGRVLRGSLDPIILDVLDDLGVCYAQAAKRKRYYRQAGFALGGSPAPAAAAAAAAPAAFAFSDTDSD